MAVANPLKLLNISGIGNAKDLKDANIECKLNSEVRVSRAVFGIQSLDSLEISFGKPVKGIGYHLQDHLQYEYMAKCKKPVTANNLIWNLFPRELYRWYKDPMTSQLQCTMVPGFGFRKLEPGDDEPGVQHHFLPASFNNHGQSQGLKKMNSFLRGR